MTDFEAAIMAVQQTQAVYALWVGLGQIAVVALGMTAMLWEGIQTGEAARRPPHRSHDRVESLD